MTHPDQIILDDTLRLRARTGADIPAIVAGLGDYDVAKWTANIPHPLTADDVPMTDDDGTPLWPKVAVIELDGACVGTIRVDGRIGYWLARPAWGRGVMTRAATAMLDAYFARVPEATEVTACVFKGNPASSRILDKLGFVEVAGACTGFSLARNAHLPQVSYALTRQAWEARG